MNIANLIPSDRPEVDLTLFVACFNEEKNIRGTLETLKQTLAEFRFSWEIIVIDDCSTDSSVRVVRDFISENQKLPIFLKVNEINRGLGYNFTECAFLGRGKYYRLVCGDDVEPVETFRKVFDALGKADMILCRQVCSGRTLFRRVLSRTYNWLVNTIGGYRISYYHGLAMHKRYNVMRWHSGSEGFGFQADLITRLLDQGVPYIEIETKARERETGKSKALHLGNFLSVAHMFQELLIRRVKRQMKLSRQRYQKKNHFVLPTQIERETKLAGAKGVPPDPWNLSAPLLGDPWAGLAFANAISGRALLFRWAFSS